MKKVNSIIIGLLAACLALWIVLCILLGAGVIGVGTPGPAGSTGATGSAGSAGKSAFEIFKQYHPDYTGTEEEWLESLKGDSGSRGATWFSGSASPESEDLTDAQSGDFYLRVYSFFSGKTGFAVYKLEDDKWVLLVDMSTEMSQEEQDKVDEFHIFDLEDLVAFSDSVNDGNTYKGKTVYLDKDVDLKDVANWSPIGTKEHYFAGTFDGNGHVISNLTINEPSMNYVGFIGYLGGGNGVITNVTFKDADVTGREGCGVAVGCVYNYGKVSNVKVLGASVKGLKDLGGIVGEGYVDIENCVVDSLTAVATPRDGDDGDKVGGIIGYLRDSNYVVSGCSVTNSSLTAYRDLGALVGCYDGAKILEKVTANTVDEVTLTVDHTVDAGSSAINVRQVVGRTVGYTDADDANEKLAETNTVGTVTIKRVGFAD